MYVCDNKIVISSIIEGPDRPGAVEGQLWEKDYFYYLQFYRALPTENIQDYRREVCLSHNNLWISKLYENNFKRNLCLCPLCFKPTHLHNICPLGIYTLNTYLPHTFYFKSNEQPLVITEEDFREFNIKYFTIDLTKLSTKELIHIYKQAKLK